MMSSSGRVLFIYDENESLLILHLGISIGLTASNPLLFHLSESQSLSESEVLLTPSFKFLSIKAS